ncbi:zinc finger and SCAN domain-containing protein 12 isoform X3 [Patella vulgata]|uniref:zinc finger and SCAN domain-containing protein 12 isoform X3 n=1 Tax=Patella vulgata TaxID=6465 RepID=UPI00217F491A|nr:zinc finger and SCAN domain-containing protein 12 isoform X3 [Patella vulgata]
MEIKQEVEGFRKEFEIFCAQFHENLIKCGKVATVMTLKQEEELTKYLLTPQDETGSSSTEIASWLENNVFCLVSNEDESHYELHIWNDTQRKVVSIENYFTVLNSMFAETGNISHDKFLKKVNEKYALIPEEVVKYFINNVTKKPKFKVTVQNKENKVYGCKVISYEYLKKRVVKKRILTEIFDKSNGKVLQSRCHEEDPLEEDVFYVEKTEKLSDITNTKFTEVSSTTYSSNQALEIKYLGKTSVAYLPPGEINNQDHLVALSNVIYSVNDFPENTGDIQLEFVIPQKQPTKVFSEIESLLSLIEKTDSGSKPTEPKTLVKTPKKNTDTKTRPNMVITPPGKLAIVANPKTRGATLKHLFNEPLISESKIPSYSELNAAAATDIVETAMEEDDDNDDDDDDDDNGHDFLENVDDLFEDSAAPEVPAQVGHKNEAQCEQNEEFILISEDTVISIENLSTEPSNVIGNPIDEIKTRVNSLSGKQTTSDVDLKSIGGAYTQTGGVNSIDERIREADLNRFGGASTHTGEESTFESKQKKWINFTKMADNSVLKGIVIADEKFSEGRSPCEKTNPSVSFKWDILQSTQKDTSIKNNANDTKLLNCRFCGAFFKDRESLGGHITRHENIEYKCKQCDKSYKSKQRPQEHSNIHKGVNSYKCDRCDASFPSSSKRSQHVYVHHVPPRFSCDTCGKSYKTKRKLTVHYRSHTGEKPYVCEVCSKAFSSNESLIKHVKIHSDLSTPQGNHVCHLCGQTYRLKHLLNAHLKRHENTEYRCYHCDKTYRDKSRLQAHVNTHMGVKPYKCSSCEESFASAQLRSAHNFQRHVPPRFSCDICNKSYKTKRKLTVHYRSHTGQKPYVCKVCSKAFSSNESLIGHNKTHSDVPDHNCPVCNKGFTQKSNMLAHNKIHLKTKQLTRSSKRTKV